MRRSSWVRSTLTVRSDIRINSFDWLTYPQYRRKAVTSTNTLVGFSDGETALARRTRSPPLAELATPQPRAAEHSGGADQSRGWTVGGGLCRPRPLVGGARRHAAGPRARPRD